MPLADERYKQLYEAFRPPVLATVFPAPNSADAAPALLEHCQAVVGAHCEEIRACLRREELQEAYEAIYALTCAVLDFLVFRTDVLLPSSSPSLEEKVFRPMALTWTALLRSFKLSRMISKVDFAPVRLCLETINHFLLRHNIAALDVSVDYMRKVLGGGGLMDM